MIIYYRNTTTLYLAFIIRNLFYNKSMSNIESYKRVLRYSNKTNNIHDYYNRIIYNINNSKFLGIIISFKIYGKYIKLFFISLPISNLLPIHIHNRSID